MLDVHPEAAGNVEKTKLAECIAACFQCALICTACTDACLAEDMIADLVPCIRTDLACADICAATGAVITRQTATNAGISRSILKACRTACAEECEKHAGMHGHCRI